MSESNLPVRKCLLVVLAVVCLLTAVVARVADAQEGPAIRTDQSGPQVSGYTLSPERYEKAISYSRARYTLYFISFGFEVILLFVLIRIRLAPRFRTWSENASSRRIVQAAVFTPLLMLTLALLELPLDLYGHSLRLTYEQSIQGWGSWAWDWLKSQMIGLCLTTFMIWILYGVIRRSIKNWWFYFWLASLPIIVFIVFITPVVIEPLFFTFDSLEKKQPDLVTEIEKVVQRGGMSIPRDRMFEMKASKKLKSVNAYVTGFSASKRVVVWDTTLQKMTTPQTLFVFGHEMGHYVLQHVMKTIAFIAVVLLLFLYVGSRGMRWAIGRFGERWNIRGIEDWASLPVLILLLSLFSFLASPVISTYSRSNEHDADIYGLEVIRGIVPDSQKSAAEAFQILGEINLSDPDPNPLIKFWLYSHPPLNERLLFARDYDPWSKGQSPKYVK